MAANERTVSARLGDLTLRARVRDAALRLVSEHGLAATSIRMVADAAGVSAGAVTHHYRSKDELIAAVQHHVVGMIRDVVSTVEPTDDPVEFARARRAAFDAFVLEHPDVAGYVRQAQLSGTDEGVALYAEAHELLRSEMDRMVASGVARPLPDPEVGLVLYGALQNAHVLLGPQIEALLDIDLSDPAQIARFREAAVDLLSRPVFGSGDLQCMADCEHSLAC